jgi:Na+-driven multidrug efflux pump
LSTIVVLDSLLFNVYSVFLTNYITNINPGLISKYQTTRIHVWADGALIGGLLALFIIGNNNIWNGMVAASVIDAVIVIMFVNNYMHIKDIKEEKYKIKEKDD